MLRNKKSVLVLVVLGLFMASCAQKTICGSKNDHKKRSSASKKMAPTMTNKR